MRLNSFGQIVADKWIRSVEIRQEIDFDEWVIMPNHMHGIVVIDANKNPNFNVGAHGVGAHGDGNGNGVGAHGDGNGVGAHGRAPLRSGVAHRRPRSLSSFVAGFKCAATKSINVLRNAAGTPVWQRNYYDRIIRNQMSLQRIQHYIRNNPVTWQNDQLHP